jgi:hypothetical protein
MEGEEYCTNTPGESCFLGENHTVDIESLKTAETLPYKLLADRSCCIRYMSARKLREALLMLSPNAGSTKPEERVGCTRLIA